MTDSTVPAADPDAPDTEAHVRRAADPAVVGPWLARTLDDEGWCAATVAPVGHGRSNLTFRVDSPAGSAVLRRPPLGAVAATAHDMGREQTVISALAGTAVPVPGVLATCSDEGVIGAPFYVMELVEGIVPSGELPEGWADTGEQRHRMGGALIDGLAALHALDPAEVGLSEFGRPEGFLARQVRRWRKQWETWREEQDRPELTRLADRLDERVPDSGAPAIVHGDYRLDNAVFAADDPGRMLAVLDWEMSTLGDPLADLGLLMIYWYQADEQPVWRDAQHLPSPTRLPGFPTRAEMVRGYTERTGADVAELPWYTAFGAFKLAVVLAGILARVRAGAVPEEMGHGLKDAIDPLVTLGHHVLDSGLD